MKINHDAWDGYTAARDRLLAYLDDHRVRNPIVLSGDWHSHWVNDLKRDYSDAAAPIVATEFVTTSISSFCIWADKVQAALEENRHVRFFNGKHRGYTVCRVTPQTWRTELKVVAEPIAISGPSTVLAAFEVRDGTPGARQVG